MRSIGRFVRVVASSSCLLACAPHVDDSPTLDPLPPSSSEDAGAGQLPEAGSVETPLDANVPSLPVTSDAASDFVDGGCGASVVEAKQVVVQQEVVVEERTDEVQPVALYITLDQSLSMDWENLWTPAKDAIKAFVNDAKAKGIDVALTFFPEGGSQCNGSGYDTPVINMGRLPEHAADIARELDKRKSAGGLGTPIEGALRGATQFCKNFEKTSAGEKCVAVLVTDGEPLGCEENTTKLAAIAETAYANGSGVRTFAVGLKGADFDLLDKIAQGGGAVDCDTKSTHFACDVSGGPSQLSTALDKIRSVVTTVKTHIETKTHIEETPVECEWTIPAPPAGQRFDRQLVNVQLSAPSLAAPIGLARVQDATACADRGWHFDDPNAPTRLVACPQTCALLHATAQARVDVLLGCATVQLL